MRFTALWSTVLMLCLCGCADPPESNLYSSLPGPTEPQADTVWTPDPEFATRQANRLPENGGSSNQSASEGNKTSDTAGATDPAAPNTVVEPSGTADTEQQTTREIKLLVPHKRFIKDRKTGALRVSYDDIDLLKVLNMEPVPEGAEAHFPEWLSKLDGQRIVIRGFMFPTFVFEGVTDFGLARDNGICCFVNEPKAYDMIEVMMAEGTSTNYIQGRPFDVEGVFRIDPLLGDENTLDRVYRIEDASVVQ